MNYGPEGQGIKALFHSRREQALIMDKSCMPGYGVLKAGTLMTTALTSKQIVPYAAVAATQPEGKSFLAISQVNGSSNMYVPNSDYPKWKAALNAAEHVIIMADAIAAQDLGAITAVTYDSQPGLTLVVGTANTSVAAFTLANKACIYVQTDTALEGSAPFMKAVYVLDQDVDTGGTLVDDPTKVSGVVPVSVVVSNAILYKTAIPNYDAAALTDLGGVADARFLILK